MKLTGDYTYTNFIPKPNLLPRIQRSIEDLELILEDDEKGDFLTSEFYYNIENTIEILKEVKELLK